MSNRFKRVYVETSIVSGMFDSNEHPEWTKPFWNAVNLGQLRIVVSDVLEREIARAPQNVRDFFALLPDSQIEKIVSTIMSDDLATQYIIGNVVGKSSLEDCRHVALATIAQADTLVSWNLKHIVKRNNGYKMINRILGYPEIEIQNPKQFMEDFNADT